MLIADSDEHLRQLLYSALLAVDVFADCVANVPDALQKIREEPYGVILVDVGLPGGNAEEIVTAIAQVRYARRPVVLVLASNPAAARSLDVDIVQIVLRKPLALRQTVELIRSCVHSASGAIAEEEDGDGDHAIS
ncbi:MAG TPA: response regulator [Thermoanaerobaculia bacterium]|nr:response regulator [Thermoanaerobaculia bacterium]